MRAIWTLAVKDLRLQLADRVGLFFVWAWPLILVVFMGYMFGDLYGRGEGVRAIPVAVVDEDRTEGSGQLVAALSQQNALRPTIAETRAAGEDLVRRGKLPVCVVIPPGFGAGRDGVFAGRRMVLEVVVDPARPIEAATARGLLQAELFRQFQALFTGERLRRSRAEVARSQEISEPRRAALGAFLHSAEGLTDEFDTTSAPAGTRPASSPARDGDGGLSQWRPFELQTREVAHAPRAGPARPRNAFTIFVPQGMAWGIMACAAVFATTLVVERTRGTLPRLLVAPIRRWQVLAGKGLACFITATGVMVGMLILARLVFGVRPVAPALLPLVLPSVGVAVVGVMMLFSVLGRTEAAVSGLSWAVLVIMAMFGGGTIPLSQLHGWLRTLSALSIFRWMIQALDGALWRDYSLADMLQPCGILLAIGFVGFGIGAAVFQRRLRA